MLLWLGSELRISDSLRPTAVSCETVDRYIIAVRRCYRSIAACRFDALCFFGLMCGTAVLLIVLSACGFWDCCFVFMHLLSAFRVVADSFFFSLCQRILNCSLRNFALARATSPCQSPRAGPQRFLVLVRVCWCCALHLLIYLLFYGFIFLHLTKMK